MAIWTLIGLLEGKATTKWPQKKSDSKSASTGTDGIIGMPDYDIKKCEAACKKCTQVCPSDALSFDDKTNKLAIDYGKCVNCQLCVEHCHTGALTSSDKWAFGVSKRENLIKPKIKIKNKDKIKNKLSKFPFRKSLHIRHVDAGSCNGCESELQALSNPFYNIERLGLFFTPSPRHADLLLVTGPVTYAMHDALIKAYEAMPEPKWVMAVGACAISGGTNGGGYSAHNGLDGILPVDFYVPGCAPTPSGITSALLNLLRGDNFVTS